MKITNEEYLAIAAREMTSRKWTVILLTKERVKQLNFGCYVCNKKNEMLYEVQCDNEGDVFWFGTSCAKKLKKVTGIDLAKVVKQQ